MNNPFTYFQRRRERLKEELLKDIQHIVCHYTEMLADLQRGLSVQNLQAHGKISADLKVAIAEATEGLHARAEDLRCQSRAMHDAAQARSSVKNFVPVRSSVPRRS